MSLVQPVTLENVVVDGRQLLPRNRPTILLACLCFLRVYTRWSFDEIGVVLLNNFPELLGLYEAEARTQLLRRLWEYTQVHRPYWLSGMSDFALGDTAWTLFHVLQRQQFRCSCMFPDGWRDGQAGEVDMWHYFGSLIGLQ